MNKNMLQDSCKFYRLRSSIEKFGKVNNDIIHREIYINSLYINIRYFSYTLTNNSSDLESGPYEAICGVSLNSIKLNKT